MALYNNKQQGPWQPHRGHTDRGGGLLQKWFKPLFAIAVLCVLFIAAGIRSSSSSSAASTMPSSTVSPAPVYYEGMSIGQLRQEVEMLRVERDTRLQSLSAVADEIAETKAAADSTAMTVAMPRPVHRDQEMGEAESEVVQRQAQVKAEEETKRAQAEAEEASALAGEANSAVELRSLERPRIRVLVWNRIAGFLDWLRDDFVSDAQEKCPTTVCEFHEDKSRLDESEGVVFHVKTHNGRDFPPHKPDGQKWVRASLEQPQYELEGNSMASDPAYLNRFDWSMTYHQDSDLPINHITPHYDIDDYYKPALPFGEKDGYGDPDAVAMFTSNCNNAGASSRLAYFEELSQYLTLHSYGNCMHNRDEPPVPEGVERSENKRVVLRRYKFYLAFENKDIQDYVSEKVYDGLLAGTLPIYKGTSGIENFLPNRDAVIDANEFGSPKELADYIKELARDEAEYDRHFEWKSSPGDRSRFVGLLDSTAYKYTALCKLCDKLANGA